LLESAPLDRYRTEAEAAVAFACRTGNEYLEQVLDSYRWLADVLLGESTAAADEAVPGDKYAGNPMAHFFAHLSRAHAAAIFGDPAGLERHTAAVMPLVPVLPGLYPTAVARLLRGLALAGQARDADADADADKRAGLLAELDELTGWLAARAADAPDNFLHLVRLVEAERAWAAGDFRAAALAFDAARREAAQRQRPWHRALIAERAARFCLARGLEQAGHDLLAGARSEYLAWGATAKVSQLDWAYPALRPAPDAIAADAPGRPADLPGQRSMVTAGTIDLLGIVSASQALSSETSIERLHARVAEVLSAMTGATVVRLLLWSEDRHGWLLPATHGDGGTVPVSGTGHERAVPLSVLRYAQRTREPLIVADAARDDRFARDPYFAGVDSCSLLAVPVLSRGGLRAVLLLENRLLAGAFTARRLDAVKLIAGQLAVSLDNAQLYAAFGQIADEQAALRRVAVLVARATPPEGVFTAVAAEAGRLLGVDFAALMRYDPRDAITVAGMWAGEDVMASSVVGTQLPLGGQNVSTLVFQTGQAARVDYADVSGAIGDVTSRKWGWRAAVGVPIRVEGWLWGVMIVALTRDGPLPLDTEARLAGFTDLAATAIANAEAQAALASSRARVVAAADQARRRIERDLHDGAQQRLVSLALQLRALQTAPPAEPSALAAELERSVAEVSGALDDLRETAQGIHPAVLAEGGLRPALGALARRCLIPVELRVHVNERLPEPVEVSAYYVIAEALTNAVKHARGSSVSVQLDVVRDVLLLTVRDDGAGGADFTRGTGLAGLKDRVEALGGQIFLNSPPGAGTNLRVELPLTASNGDVTTF
jgi:signal transduction histidine kinase